MIFVGPDDRHERAVAVEQSPHRGRFHERRFARASRHGEGKELPVNDSRFDLGDRRQVIVGPLQDERGWKVRFAEEAERQFCGVLPGRIDYRRKIADVAAGLGQLGLAGGGPILV